MEDLADQLLTVVLAHMPHARVNESIIFWNKIQISKSARLTCGPNVHEVPFDGYHVFVDLMPQANWGHPVMHLFIDVDLNKVATIEDQFTPWFNGLPDSVIVLLRYGRPPQDENNPDPFGK